MIQKFGPEVVWVYNELQKRGINAELYLDPQNEDPTIEYKDFFLYYVSYKNGFRPNADKKYWGWDLQDTTDPNNVGRGQYVVCQIHDEKEILDIFLRHIGHKK